MAGAAALLESGVEAALVFGKGHVPLFLWGGDRSSSTDASGGGGDLSPAKWGYWFARSLLFASLYALVLRVPRSPRWRDLLPATPRFFRYCSALCCVHAATAMGSLLLLLPGGGGGGGGGGEGQHHHHFWGANLLRWPGYCVLGLASGAYYGLFPAALYSAFLAAFFADSALDLDSFYYSEMMDAGFEAGGGIGSESSLIGGGGGGGGGGEVGF